MVREGFEIGDCVDVTYINDIIIYGEIDKITDTGFILKMIDGSRIAISFDRIRAIRLIHEKGEDMKHIKYCETCKHKHFVDISDKRCSHCITLIGGIPSEYNKNDDFLQFAVDNLNKRIVIETSHGLGYEGVLEDYNLRTNKLSIITYSGIVDVPRDIITKYYIENEEDSKMSPETFKSLLDELDGNSLQTLKEKNAKYAVDGDCLHNFRSGAEIMGGTPAQACWGYITKHLVALRDKVEKNDFSDREDFLEKCQDTINYIRFLWCIGNDASNSENNNKGE